ncbi:MAG: tetratricopeptide repeat protein [Nitrospira sp.]|nr:tetratricopeptide repeat protein [Nitrospira sp.]MDH4344497.1 tetratricopeptide repeat protein [Nitrospira sp.]
MRAVSLSGRPFLHAGIPLLFYCTLSTLSGVGTAQPQNTDAPSSRALLEQAKDHESAQRYHDAIPLYREVLQREPERDDVQAALARLLSWQGAHAEAADLYRGILRRHPVDLDIRTALARVLSWQQHMDESRTLYEGVLREQARHPEALQGLADILLWEGRSEEALRYYEQAYAVSGDVAVAERIASIRSTLAEQGPMSPATVPPPVSDGRAETIARAQAWERNAEYGPAIAAYRQILAEHPEDDEVNGALARLLARDGQLEQASSLYRDILTRHPADVDVQLGLARVRSWQKQFSAAIRLYEAVLQQNGENRDALRGLADTLFWSGAAQEALAHYAQLAKATEDRESAARVQAITASLEASPQAPLGLRDSILRLPYRDYVKLGYGRFSYSRDIPDERNILFEAAKSLGAYTVIARVEPITRFGFHDTPLSGELYSPLWRRAWGYLAAQGTINPHFSPNYSVAGEITQGLGIAHPILSPLEVSLGYRHLSYKTGDSDLLIPGLTIFLPFNVWLTEKLYYVPETGALTLASRLTWRPTNRLQLFASGSFGTSGERIVATQDLTRVSSHAVQGGITLPIADRLSLEATGFYEDRGILYLRQGGSFSIIYHW